MWHCSWTSLKKLNKVGYLHSFFLPPSLCLFHFFLQGYLSLHLLFLPLVLLFFLSPPSLHLFFLLGSGCSSLSCPCLFVGDGLEPGLLCTSLQQTMFNMRFFCLLLLYNNILLLSSATCLDRSYIYVEFVSLQPSYTFFTKQKVTTIQLRFAFLTVI